MACDRRPERTACISLPAFPLQLQLREKPQWHQFPCAVIDCDKPQGTLLWVNDNARRQRILPGMRYAAALALARDLRAAEISPDRIQQAVERLTAEVLTTFSPRVEASESEPGVFWLDLSGMERLFPDLESWAGTLSRRLTEEGFVSRVVVGWSRFHAYALAKGKANDFVIPAAGGVGGGDFNISKKIPAPLSDITTPENVGAGVYPPPTPGGAQGPSPTGREPTANETGRAQILLCRSPDHERQLADRVPLHRLGLDPAVREALDDLGITALGEFIALPHEGIERRFGQEAAQLHQQACGQRQPPLEAEEIAVEVSERIFLEESVRDLSRLMLWLESLLDSCLMSLIQRGEVACALDLDLFLENGSVAHEELRTAEPTNDRKQWLELLALRLDSVRLGEGAQEIALGLAGKRVPPGQMDLFAVEPRRDLSAANRALARIRAELGNTVVQRAEIRDGHLPEARFSWRPFEHLDEARPARIASARLVRRLFTRPKRLPPRPRQEPDGWLLRGLTDCPVDKVRGPFVIAGGWWRRPVHREYHYAETRKGEVLWAYYDRYRRRWFLQGRIE